MQIEKLLSYQQLMWAISLSDVNVAHCASTGLAVDLYIIDNCEFEEDVDKERVIDVLNIFTQTSKIVFNNIYSYSFADDDIVDITEQKLLHLFQLLRNNRFRATGIFEDDEYIGFQGRFGRVLKARKVVGDK